MKTLVFLHIPKTGGTTVSKILDDHFAYNEVFTVDTYNPQSSWDILKREDRTFKLIKGHHVLGIHKLIQTPVEYFCYVREPVDHFLSTFYYIKSRTGNRFNKLIDGMSLEEFLDSDAIDTIPDFDNYQTRMFTGLYFAKRSLIKDGDELEAVARRNAEIIKNIFLTEDFNNGLDFISQRYGIEIPDDIKRENVTNRRRRVEDISDEVKHKIEKRVKHDIALYEFCRSMNIKK